MFSRNLSVPDFVRRFFVSCAQISEAYAVRTLMKFGCNWRKIGRKIKCMKDSESTFLNVTFSNYVFLYRAKNAETPDLSQTCCLGHISGPGVFLLHLPSCKYRVE